MVCNVLSFHMYYLLFTRCLVYDKQLAFSPAVAHWGLGSVSEIGPSTRCPAAWEGAVAQDKYNSQSPADSQIKREATQTTRIMANSSFKLKFNIMAHGWWGWRDYLPTLIKAIFKILKSIADVVKISRVSPPAPPLT